MMRMGKDFLLAVKQSLKLQWKGRMTWIVLLLGMFFLGVMLSGMEQVKEEKSRISIGIVDQDGSLLSRRVIEQMQQLDLYEVTLGEEKELTGQLQRGGLSAVCVLRSGYERMVQAGETDRLVLIYEPEQGEAPLVGDILAGIMLQDICRAKGYLTLEEYRQKTGKDKMTSYEEYLSYVNALEEELGVHFSFEISYQTQEGGVTNRPAQEILYSQAIFAVFTLMTGVIALYAALPFWETAHGAVSGKMRTLPVSRISFFVGNAMGTFILPGGFSLLFLGFYFGKNPVQPDQILSILVCTGAYLCVIVCIVLAAAYGIRSRTVYQTGMLAMLMVFGVFGLVTVVEGVLVPEGVSDYIPNGWYVRRITELMNYGR